MAICCSKVDWRTASVRMRALQLWHLASLVARKSQLLTVNLVRFQAQLVATWTRMRDRTCDRLRLTCRRAALKVRPLCTASTPTIHRFWTSVQIWVQFPKVRLDSQILSPGRFTLLKVRNLLMIFYQYPCFEVVSNKNIWSHHNINFLALLLPIVIIFDYYIITNFPWIFQLAIQNSLTL